MSWRFQKFTSVYPEYIRQFLAAHPECETSIFDEIYSRLINTYYGLSNYYAVHMTALGHCAEDLFVNLEVLQKAWARERKLNYGRETWLRDIVIGQIREFKPDVLFLQDLYILDGEFRRYIREAYRSDVFIIGWRAAPTEDFGAFRDIDLILSSVPNFVEAFERNGVRAKCMPFGFESSILANVKMPSHREHEFAFLGSLGHPRGAHSQRYALIRDLMRQTSLEVWGEAVRSNSLTCRVVSKGMRMLGLDSKGRRGGDAGAGRRLARVGSGTNPLWDRYPTRCHDSLYGKQYYELLANTRVVLNSHIDIAGKYAGNMRLFEATGMGACLLTDWKENLGDLFEPDKEVMTFRDIDECIDKAKYLLKNDAIREKIALAGQRRTLKDHNYFRRIRGLCNVVDRYLCQNCS